MSVAYRVRGDYFESCNCDVICPCRMIGGVKGGRSTHGICFGVLSWHIVEGHVGDVDVSALAVALVDRYDDDEPGSPWTIRLHVDARGNDQQRAAIRALFLGELGGDHIAILPWVKKARHLTDVRTSAISLDRDGDGYRLRVGDAIAARASRAVETDLSVACLMPGYDRDGRELHADELRVREAPFEWELTGTCAFATDFEYASE
jgi:hypothetical protein